MSIRYLKIFDHECLSLVVIRMPNSTINNNNKNFVPPLMFPPLMFPPIMDGHKNGKFDNK